MLKTLTQKKSRPDLRMAYVRTEPRAQKTVLVALDGGPVAERALPMAAMLARRWQAPLRLVHVCNPVELSEPIGLSLIDSSQSLALHNRVEAYLSGWAKSLHKAHDVKVECDAAVESSIESRLRSLCESNTRLLVMVRTGRSLRSRFWSGSVTDRLIGRLPVPLLLLPEKGYGNDALASEDAFARLLIHFETARTSATVLQSAMDVAAPKSECHVLRVLPLTSFCGAGRRGVAAAFDRHNQPWLELFKAQDALEAHGLRARPKLIVDGQTAGAAILEQARATRSQLIVIGARHPSLPWWLRDRIAEYVVRRTHLPVLIVPEASR